MNVRQVQNGDPDYRVVRELGAGGSGTVFLVVKRSTGQQLACKAVNLVAKPQSGSGAPTSYLNTYGVEQTIRMLENELQTMWALRNNQYVVNFVGDCSVDTETATVRAYLDYYRGGSLDDVIKSWRSSGPIFNLTILNWALNIAKGLAVCHNHPKRYLHRDMKPGNVLLQYEYDHDELLQAIDQRKDLSRASFKAQLRAIASEPDSFISDCYVSDFGLGKQAVDLIRSRANASQTGAVGTPGFIAPEVEQGAPHLKESDIYAYGVTLWCLCTRNRSPLFTGGFTPIPPQYPVGLRNLIFQCLTKSPALRPSVDKVIATLTPLLDDHMADFNSKAPQELLQPEQVYHSMSTPMATYAAPGRMRFDHRFNVDTAQQSTGYTSAIPQQQYGTQHPDDSGGLVAAIATILCCCCTLCCSAA